MARMIALEARGVAASMSSVGYCYRGVKRALKKVGVALTGGEAFMAKSQLADDPRFTKVPMSKLQTGDILVHGASKAHPHGHIAVYLGNGKEASDHIGRLITGGRYGGTTVFRVKGTPAPTAVAVAPKPKHKVTSVIASAVKPHRKSTSEARVIAASIQQDRVDHAVKVAQARIEQQAKQQEAIAHAVRVAKPAALRSPFVDFTSALTRFLPIAETAQLNVTAALANVIPDAVQEMTN